MDTRISDIIKNSTKAKNVTGRKKVASRIEKGFFSGTKVKNCCTLFQFWKKIEWKDVNLNIVLFGIEKDWKASTIWLSLLTSDGHFSPSDRHLKWRHFSMTSTICSSLQVSVTSKNFQKFFSISNDVKLPKMPK